MNNVKQLWGAEGFMGKMPEKKEPTPVTNSPTPIATRTGKLTKGCSVKGCSSESVEVRLLK